MHVVKVETNRKKVIQRLEQDAWVLTREAGKHDIYTHDEIRFAIPVPRHRTLTPGTARSIARRAGWI